MSTWRGRGREPLHQGGPRRSPRQQLASLAEVAGGASWEEHMPLTFRDLMGGGAGGRVERGAGTGGSSGRHRHR